MKKRNLLISVLGILALAGTAFGAEIADISWDQSNLETLRSFKEADVVRFLNSGLVEQPFVSFTHGDEESVTARDIEEFTWANLLGNNQYQLVVVFAPIGTSGANAMSIYSRDSSGKISEQEMGGLGIRLDGWQDLPYIPKVIQDLNGDGKDELVIPESLGSFGDRSSPIAVWPQVYWLQDGTYVEASRDFVKFYDTQVLPYLDTGITNAREAAALEAQKMPGAPYKDRRAQQQLDAFTVTRGKILQVIGRDPKASER